MCKKVGDLPSAHIDLPEGAQAYVMPERLGIMERGIQRTPFFTNVGYLT